MINLQGMYLNSSYPLIKEFFEFVEIVVAVIVVVCVTEELFHKLHSVKNSDTARKVFHFLSIRRVRNLKLLHYFGQ